MFFVDLDVEWEKEQLLKDEGAGSSKATLSQWNRLFNVSRHRWTSQKILLPPGKTRETGAKVAVEGVGAWKPGVCWVLSLGPCVTLGQPFPLLASVSHRHRAMSTPLHEKLALQGRGESLKPQES
ncbi:uncharacterized protein VSU04_013654 isoform 2-T2 [Chlamydotis macqueenii]